MHLQENYKMEEFSFSLSHYSIRHHFSILSNDSHMLGFEIFFNVWIIFGLFHFRKDLYYIETSKIINSVNHLTGFCLILPFIEKEVLNSLYSVYCIQLNSLYLLNLILANSISLITKTASKATFIKRSLK